MSKLLEEASSPRILNTAWRFLKNDKAIWSPGISKKDMEQNIVYHMNRLSEELRTGQYTPDITRFFTVEKGDGKQRIISAITLRDKVAQRAILTVLEPLGEKRFHPGSYGYRPGRNVDMAVSKAREYVLCGMEWVVDADIKKYFDNICHRLLLRKLKSWLNDRKLIALIKKWLDAGTPRKGFLDRPRGIPQGAILSPFLCNVYLNDFDYEITNKNLPLVRFADDFIVFAKTRKDAENAHVYVSKCLKKIHLELHPQKTRVVQCSPKVVFLGKKLPYPAGKKKGTLL